MDILEEMNYRVQHRIVSSTRLRGDNWDAMARGAAEIEALRSQNRELAAEICTMAADEIERLRRQNRELVTELKIRDGIISDMQDRLAALDAEGYVLVPLEPTPAMLAAVSDIPTIAASIWKDMLAAARRQDI